MTDEAPKLKRKKPFHCGFCGGARFFVYSDRNDVVCVKCRSVFHVYPLEAEIEQSRFQRTRVL
jgi:hypothetical protein